MSEAITREEHNRDVDRIHERIDKQDDSILRIELAVQKIESVANSQHEIWKRIHNELYEKDGIKEKVLRLGVHKNIQWVFLSTIALGILGRAIWIIANHLSQ